jgi:hypothetical protein
VYGFFVVVVVVNLESEKTTYYFLLEVACSRRILKSCARHGLRLFRPVLQLLIEKREMNQRLVEISSAATDLLLSV